MGVTHVTVVIRNPADPEKTEVDPILWTAGSGVKVDSMRFVMLPFGERIPPSAFCHRRGSSEVVPRCSI